MGRNRKRKYPTEKGTQTEKENIIPIQNLPENYLAIKVNNILIFCFDFSTIIVCCHFVEC